MFTNLELLTDLGTIRVHQFRRNVSIATAPFPNIIDVKWFGAKGDGTTDDWKAIQTALDVCASRGGGEVFVPPGRYRHTQPLVMDSNVTLRGAGRQLTTLKHNGADWAPGAGVVGLAAVVCNGTAFVSKQNVALKQLKIEGSYVVPGGGPDANDEVHGRQGTNFAFCNNVLIEECWGSNCEGELFYCSGSCTNVRMVGNWVNDTAHSAYNINGAAYDCAFIDNYCDNVGAHGLELCGQGAVIQGNRFSRCGLWGMALGENGSPAVVTYPRPTVVSGNLIEGNNFASPGGATGGIVLIYGAYGFALTGNTIFRCKGPALLIDNDTIFPAPGSNPSRFCLVNGNLIYNNNINLGGQAQVAIESVENMHVVNNLIYSFPTHEYAETANIGLKLTGNSTSSVIEGNHIYGHDTADIQNFGTWPGLGRNFTTAGWKGGHDLESILTANLPAAGAYRGLVAEDLGAGNANLVFYTATKRFRIAGGVAF